MDALPEHPHPELHLPRVADAALHGAVEVEDQVRHFGAVEVLAVEEIEDVDGRLESCTCRTGSPW